MTKTNINQLNPKHTYYQLSYLLYLCAVVHVE